MTQPTSPKKPSKPSLLKSLSFYLSSLFVRNLELPADLGIFERISQVVASGETVLSETINSTAKATLGNLTSFGWAKIGGELVEESTLKSAHFSANCDHMMPYLTAKESSSFAAIEECKQRAYKIVTFLLEAKYTQVTLSDVSQNLFTDLSALEEIYDIFFTPQSQVGELIVGSMVLVARTEHNSYQIALIPDEQGVQVLPNGVGLYSTTCVIINNQRIVGSCHGSPFSSPSARAKTFAKITSFLTEKKLPFHIGGDWNTYCSVDSTKGLNPVNFLPEILLDNDRENIARIRSLPKTMFYNLPEIPTFLGASVDDTGISAKLKKFLFSYLIRYKLDVIFSSQKTKIITTKLPHTDHLAVEMELERLDKKH